MLNAKIFTIFDENALIIMIMSKKSNSKDREARPICQTKVYPNWGELKTKDYDAF